MPLPIQIGTVTQALQRAFGFKGRYTPMLDEVIVPVYVISDPSPAQVTRIAAGTQRVTNVGQPTADLGFLQLFNPVGSGVALVVSAAVLTSDVKQAIIVSFFDGPATTDTGDIAFRDRRNRGKPSGRIRSDNTTGGTAFLGEAVAVLDVDGAFSQSAAWAVESTDPRQPLAVLDEGKGLAFQSQDTTLEGSSIRANIMWLEVAITEQRPPGGLP